MRYTGMILFLGIQLHVAAQQYEKARKNDVLPDSGRMIGWREDIPQELPVVSLNDDARHDGSGTYIPSLLNASRDIVLDAAAFHFNMMHFRLRGYDAQWSGTLINGIVMNNPEDGTIPWTYWSGLNDVTRNTQVIPFLQAGEADIGNIGITNSIDMRAYKQRVQTQVGYSLSNRSYTNRLSITYATGMNAKGLAFAISATCRYAQQGYLPGTFVQGAGYYIAADKRMHNEGLLSVCLFGNAALRGKQSAVTHEAAEMAGSRFYNAYWGYLDGRKKNANTSYTHVPVLLVNYEQKKDRLSYLLSAAVMYGTRTATSLDWYHAPDPRPDYYRNLPSYYQDSTLQRTLLQAYTADAGMMQIDWDRIYDINRNSLETTYGIDGDPGKSFTGLRSHYILQERITTVRRICAAWQYQYTPADAVSVAGGISAQWQRLHYYETVDDLLGGEYYMNWNQFAEGDAAVIQNDLDHPDRILRQGDRYGYDYLMVHGIASGWTQATIAGRRCDWMLAARLGYVTYYRDGLVRTGTFPEQSLGRSVVYEFGEYTLKAGITYKIDGRHYLRLAVACMNKAPSADNVFISPRMRNTEQETIDMQQIRNAELGYYIQAPRLRFRATAYITKFTKGMDVLSFYHDAYRSFVNYAMSGIDRLHYGTELGIEWKISSRYTLSGAASMGTFLYTNRYAVTVTADNDAYVLERGLVYAKNLRTGGTPQQAYAMILSYQRGNGYYLSLSASYFREYWLEANPIRRTYTAVSGLIPGTDTWKQVLAQQRLPDQYTLDISGGNSFRVNKKGTKQRMLSVYAGIHNLLNRKDMIAGGYEQLRYDNNYPDRFPPKFFYAMGLNFSVSISFKW